jgi:hypothetical protein
MSEAQNQVQEPIENLDAEAIKAEETALKGVDQSEVRKSIIEKYGLDEDANADLIEALTKDKLEEQKKFSTVIKQKRSWREKANNPEVKTEIKQVVTPPVGQYVTKEELEQRDIDSLAISDELKVEVKRYAKLNNVSIKVAESSPYISFLKEKEVAKAKTEEASIGNKRVSQAKKDFSEKSPADFDRSTPEGRKEWDEYKAWLKTQ